MRDYTVRFAHMARQCHLPVGSVVHSGDLLGEMGSTGQSTGSHLHIDVVQGFHADMFRMSNIGCSGRIPDFEQLQFFIDENLGKGPYRITTFPYDPRYVIQGKWKAHPGCDVVLDSGLIYWNRSMDGRVVRNAFDNGYGNHLHVVFKAP